MVIFASTFVGGWALQLIGHVFEGKKPALMDNFFQVFIAPIFLMAELFFAFGYKREVAERMEQLASTLGARPTVLAAHPKVARSGNPARTAR